MTTLPTSGGSYTRDLLTGELTRMPDGPEPRAEPQPETPATPVPVVPKGGK